MHLSRTLHRYILAELVHPRMPLHRWLVVTSNDRTQCGDRIVGLGHRNAFTEIRRQARAAMCRSRFTQFVADFFAPELQAWRGEQPLWRVFWIYGVTTSAGLIALWGLGFYLDRVALRQAVVLCFAPYTGWVLVSVWRCANNTNQEMWTLLARLLTLAWACNAVLVIVSVQFNLITRYYLH